MATSGVFVIGISVSELRIADGKFTSKDRRDSKMKS